MSRIGRRPVTLPKGVKISMQGNTFIAEGSKGKLAIDVPSRISIEIKEDKIFFSRKTDEKTDRALHGLIRNLVNNTVLGVSDGYERKLDIHGVGYKAQMKGKIINLSLGYSHSIDYEIPAGVTVTVPQPTAVVIQGIDKMLVGKVASSIRSFCKPEPYKGKGVRYSDENIRRKQGKVVG